MHPMRSLPHPTPTRHKTAPRPWPRGSGLPLLLLLSLSLLASLSTAWAQVPNSPASHPQPPASTPAAEIPRAVNEHAVPSRSTLPPAVQATLERAGVPLSALAVSIAEVSHADQPRLALNTNTPMNPASLMKLYTSFAGLSLLGPAYVWTTPVWLDGEVHQPGRSGVLDGSVYLQGRGDPKLVMERLWLLLKRLQSLGVREIRGDIVLDRSGLQPEAPAPDAFDADPLRPYNVQADALLVNFKAVTLTFRPDPDQRVAWVSTDPALSDVALPRAVSLSRETCGDFHAQLQPEVSEQRLRFKGRYPSDCGERQWPLAFPGPARFNAAAIEGAWRELGGRLIGRVREGTAPSHRPPTFVFESPPLAEIVRDLNKHSNNVMAQHLFLTLGRELGGVGNPNTSREVLSRFLRERTGCVAPQLVIDNGSGLSRDTRSSAACLSRLLQAAWASPVMPELMSALPVAGVDGTVRKSHGGQGFGPAQGQAHLKTGTLADSTGLAGYVLGRSGKRYVFVGIVNHPNASAVRPALEHLVQWTAED